MQRMRRLPLRVVCLVVFACMGAGAAVHFAAPAGAAHAHGTPRQQVSIPGQMIVGFRRGSTARSQNALVHAAGAHVIRRFGPIDAALVGFQPGTRTAAALHASPQVRYAEPNFVIQADAVPDDPSFPLQWGLQNTGQAVNFVSGTAGDDVHAAGAWGVTTGSRTVRVAVLDTGIDLTHPDLAANVWTNPGESCSGCQTNGVDDDGNGYADDVHGWNCITGSNDATDDNGHGTHVAGIIGAAGNNHIGVAGVNWQVSLVPVKFIGADGSGTTAGAICSILYAISINADVMNASWGDTEYSQALHDAIGLADQHGALFVAAAGNDSVNNDTSPHYPASYDLPNVISVAATDQNDARAWFSDYGPTSVDIGAPGQNIYSTWPGGGYQFLDGTSMATPFVSGAAALVKAAFPNASAVGTKALLMRTADADTSLAGRTTSGGRLDASAALHCTNDGEVWVEAPGPGFVAFEGQSLPISVIATNCASPSGVAASVTVNGSAVSLTGRGDGLYTGTFTPSSPGPLTLIATATAGSTASQTVTGTVPTPIVPGGDPVTVTVPTAGGRALLSFAGAAGQRISAATTASTITSSKIWISAPDGSLLVGPTIIGTAGHFIDTHTLPLSGYYTIVVAPQSTYTGSLTLTLYNVPDDASGQITPGGPPVSIATGTPGQNAALTFSGIAGRRVSMLASGVSYSQMYLSLLAPDGSMIAGPTLVGPAGGFIDTRALPTTGTYTVFVNPSNGTTGSATITLYDVPPDVSTSIVPGGSPVTVGPGTPGQNAQLQFAGSAGRRVSLKITADTIKQAYVSIVNPDGSTLAPRALIGTTGGFIDTHTLPATGSYTIVVDPVQSATGSAALTLYDVPPDVQSAIAPGGPGVSVAANTPGQGGVLTFTGVAGGRISLRISAGSFAQLKTSIMSPDGTTLASLTTFGTTGGFIDTRTLPLSGTYTIQVDPVGAATGSVTLTLYSVPDDVTGTASVGGAGLTISTAVPGQNARVTFGGTAGASLTVRLTGVSYTQVAVSVLNPDGTVLAPVRYVGPSGASIVLTTASSGTYTIMLDPSQAYTGTATVAITSP